MGNSTELPEINGTVLATVRKVGTRAQDLSEQVIRFGRQLPRLALDEGFAVYENLTGKEIVLPSDLVEDYKDLLKRKATLPDGSVISYPDYYVAARAANVLEELQKHSNLQVEDGSLGKRYFATLASYVHRMADASIQPESENTRFSSQPEPVDTRTRWQKIKGVPQPRSLTPNELFYLQQQLFALKGEVVTRINLKDLAALIEQFHDIDTDRKHAHDIVTGLLPHLGGIMGHIAAEAIPAGRLARFATGNRLHKMGKKFGHALDRHMGQKAVVELENGDVVTKTIKHSDNPDYDYMPYTISLINVINTLIVDGAIPMEKLGISKKATISLEDAHDFARALLFTQPNLFETHRSNIFYLDEIKRLLAQSDSSSPSRRD